MALLTLQLSNFSFCSRTNDPDPALDPANAVMVESSNKNKTIIGIIVGVVLLIAGIGIGIGVHHGGGGDNKEWTGLCLQCQAKECSDGELGSSIQCMNDTVSCTYETGNNGKISRHCGPLDELPPSLKMNVCVKLVRNIY